MNARAWIAGFFTATFVAATPCSGETNLSPPDLWFPVGEELVYRMTWGFIPIGKSRIKSQWIEEHGKQLLYIRYRTMTNAIFNKIYPMNDVAEAFIDPAGFRPTRFVFKKARRRPMCDETVTFDYENGTARVVSGCENTIQVFPLDTNTTDIITFMYGMRKHPIEKGLSVSNTVMDTEGPLPLRLEVTEGEDIKLSVFGKVPCVKVTPEIDLKNMLVEKGQITIWVSRDARRLATYMVVKSPVANVRATLCQVRGPGDDAWTEAMKKNGDKAACSVSDDIDKELDAE